MDVKVVVIGVLGLLVDVLDGLVELFLLLL